MRGRRPDVHPWSLHRRRSRPPRMPDGEDDGVKVSTARAIRRRRAGGPAGSRCSTRTPTARPVTATARASRMGTSPRYRCTLPVDGTRAMEALRPAGAPVQPSRAPLTSPACMVFSTGRCIIRRACLDVRPCTPHHLKASRTLSRSS
ncbi:hypothetical protein [Ornithinimicrobium kibberense]|uniref:hypothetical protein n=1 Tax=Ornithinimicrobium kibberense TaxID=282060 RepID=UPI0036149443